MRDAGTAAPVSRRFSARHFLGVLVVMFLASPFLDDVYRRWPAVSALIVTIVLLSAALAVGDRRRIKIWAGLLTTLSTVGYGDIVPVAPVARLLSTIEAVAGMFFVTLLIARLVSVYSSGDRTENP